MRARVLTMTTSEAGVRRRTVVRCEEIIEWIKERLQLPNHP